MKKSTKILAATLAVLPCALMLTACGNKTQPLLEGYHEASYTETTYEEFNQEISARGEAELVGLKARTKLNATVTTDLSAFVGLPGMPELPTEPIIDTYELENTTVASGFGAEATGKVASDFSLKINKDKFSAHAYYTDKTFFVDLTGLNLEKRLGEHYIEGIDKFSYNVGETTTYDEPPSQTTFTLDIAALLAMIDETDYAQVKTDLLNMATWSSEKTDTSYKVKVTFDGEALTEYVTTVAGQLESEALAMFEEFTVTTFNLYLVYGETALEGFALDFEGSMKLNMDGIGYETELKLNTEVVPTTEEAKLPSGLTVERYPALDPSIFDGFLPQE